MSATHLTGLTGTNPLAFLAALGVQVLFDGQDQQPRLWWTDDVIPHAVVDNHFDVDRIIHQALTVFPRWLNSSALNPGFDTKVNNDAKFSDEQLRHYLEKNETGKSQDRLASSLVAEGSYDGSGRAKPSDLYLSAGRVAFLRDARKILSQVTNYQLVNALEGPWRYDSRLPSLRWDVIDDPNWALAATKPGVKKRTCPGPEALALLGFSLFPVFGRNGRTDTQNCEGTWNNGRFVWPLWTEPIRLRVVRSLLAHITTSPPELDRRKPWFKAWSIKCIMESSINRSKAASGLGNMGPASIAYSIDTE